MEFLDSHGTPPPFRPAPFYSPDGDSLTFYIQNKPSYRQRIDDFLTVYRAIEGDALVGCQIKGLPKTLELLGSFGLRISDGRVKLTFIFLATAMQSENPETKEICAALSRAAKETELELAGAELV